MFSSVLLCALAAISCHLVYAVYTNFADTECGVSSRRAAFRIVGGVNASQGEFPWLVSLKKMLPTVADTECGVSSRRAAARIVGGVNASQGEFPWLVALKTMLSTVADTECGVSSRRAAARIVGGVNASQGEFPWLVSLKKGRTHLCGGTLITSDWVLTAAHCLCSGLEVMKVKELRVAVGVHDLRQARDLDMPVARMVLHPQYRCDHYLHDVAVLRLGAAVTWGPTVLPACLPLPTPEQSYADVEAEVAGWGWTDENFSKGYRSDVVRKVRLTIVDNTKCQQWYSSQGKRLRIQASQMCAGVESGGKDACQADSGGPLMVGEGSDVVVVGVVSSGIGCARPKLPGLYTRVTHYLDWISETIIS